MSTFLDKVFVLHRKCYLKRWHTELLILITQQKACQIFTNKIVQVNLREKKFEIEVESLITGSKLCDQL